MTKSLTKVVYKPDTQSTDEYSVIINPVEYKKWKEGGKVRAPCCGFTANDSYGLNSTIPLAEVVDSFKCFHSNQGAQGILGTPSKQQLDTVFGTTKDVDVLTEILRKGKEQTGSGFNSGPGMVGTNMARGSFAMDNKSKGSMGV